VGELLEEEKRAMALDQGAMTERARAAETVLFDATAEIAAVEFES